MSSLVPFSHKTKLAKDPLSNMLDDFFDDAWLPLRSPNMGTFKLDVKDDKTHYTVEAEVPGAQKKDIALDLTDGRLTIGVSAREITDDDKKKYIHKERRYSYMERSVYLADSAAEGAKAKLEHGELIVTVPKAKNDIKTQKIEIK